MKRKEKEEIIRFRKYVEDRVNRFAKDQRHFIEFQPLERLHRTIIHEVADIAGMMGFSFGVDGMDRYTVIYKKEFSPTEDELAARRNGEAWNEETAKKYAQERKLRKQCDSQEVSNKTVEKIVPSSNYKDKYVHLIGQESALEAARKTQTNEKYGFVPTKNKKDTRSIEQTMADIQAKKRIKLELEQQNAATNETTES
ncbi:SPAG7 family protein [Megaselia abdita]